MLPILGCKQKKASSEDKIQVKADGKSKPERRVVKFQPDKIFKSSEATEVWKQFRAVADSLGTADKGRLLLFAKCGDEEGKGPTRLVAVPDKDHWPEDRLEVYVVLVDESRKVVLFQVVPMSASGDWAESEDFYADSNGIIRYWEFFRATIDSLEEPGKAWQAISRNRDGSAIERIGLAVDSDGRLWKKGKPPQNPVPPQRIKSVLENFGLVDSLKVAKVSIS